VAKWKVREKKMPTMVLDMNGNVIQDKGQMKGVWKGAWMSLGLEDMEDERFDEEFAKMIGEEAKRMRREEKESDRRESNDERTVRWINAPILLKEVRGVMTRLKKGKAMGVDGLITELFKYGGERMVYCVWALFQKVWKEGTIPDDWSKGIVVPIFKKGDRRDPFNYRGISLLSVVGKMFTTILSDRLMRFCEDNAIIVDEQGGFRKGRGCPDQLFAMTEVLNFRKGKKTCCCFIDIKKAYDTVFRDGLWVKLHQAGVQGKMWRMITNIYNKVESCVLVDGATTSWFEVEVGVRQGCVVSPILFSIFVDGLARKIKESGLGVGIEAGEEDKLGLLMYADDIVLIASNEKELQRMIDIVVGYSHKWRFELNHKKTEIVIFGGKGKKCCFWLKAYDKEGKWEGDKDDVNRVLAAKKAVEEAIKTAREKGATEELVDEAANAAAAGLGMTQLKSVDKYTYLGLVIKKNRSWKDSKGKAINKARRCMAMSWGMGIHVGGLSTKAAVNAWKALIRPVMEYGAEVIQYSRNLSGKWDEAEKIQMQMGRRILGCSSTTSNAAVRGDLGWQSLKARRDMLRLTYWGKIINMKGKRWTRRIYEESRRRYEEKGKANWCTYTHHILKEYGLEEAWVKGRVGQLKVWKVRVTTAIKKYEEMKWKQDLEQKPKLRTYRVLKKSLEEEDYVMKNRINEGRKLLTGMRSGTNDLRIDTDRRYNCKIPVQERTCWCCGEGVEDEKHFVVLCKHYQNERLDMFQDILKVTEGRFSLGSLQYVHPTRYSIQISDRKRRKLQKSRSDEMCSKIFEQGDE
jgi:hypothetical protein